MFCSVNDPLAILSLSVNERVMMLFQFLRGDERSSDTYVGRFAGKV